MKTMISKTILLLALGFCAGWIGCSEPSALQLTGSMGSASSISSSSMPGSLSPGSTTSVPYPGETGTPIGILNGHFDVDTAVMAYPTDQGHTNHHVHKYDKQYATTSIDFFNMIDPAFNEVQKTLSTTQRFVLNVVNGQMSSGGVLSINGANVKVSDFQKQTQQTIQAGKTPQIYTIGTPSVGGDLQLSSLTLGFSPNVLAQQGLLSTLPPCVQQNAPGANGEYRDGALVIQAIDIAHLSLDPTTGAESLSAGGLLWETMVYSHWSGPCY